MYSRRRRRKLQFLITAGGTREYIDPVRFISNASSGKMGYELAQAALSAGHEVILITAPTNLKPPGRAKLINVESAGDMFEAVKNNFGKCDCLIMNAAVSDYTPAKFSPKKIKKSSLIINLKLKATPDILKWTGNHKKKNQMVIGFALEDRNIKSNAEEKMLDKKIDLIVVNKPEVIGSENSKIWVKKPKEKWLEFPVMSKKQLARGLIRIIEQSFQLD